MSPEWKKILEVHKPWISLRLEIAKVDEEPYLMLFVDDFDEWKEFSIYKVGKKAKEIEEIAKKIEEAEDTNEIAKVISEVVDEFIIGEVAEVLGICAEDDYIVHPDEDEKLNWPLCFIRDNPSAWIHLRRLYQHGLIPNEWVPYVKKLLYC